MKDCPFCGGKAEHSCRGAYDYGAYTHRVHCQLCGAAGPGVYQSYHDSYDETKTKALMLWNKRA